MHYQESTLFFSCLKPSFLALIILRNCIKRMMISSLSIVNATKGQAKTFISSINIALKVKGFVMNINLRPHGLGHWLGPFLLISFIFN